MPFVGDHGECPRGKSYVRWGVGLGFVQQHALLLRLTAFSRLS